MLLSEHSIHLILTFALRTVCPFKWAYFWSDRLEPLPSAHLLQGWADVQPSRLLQQNQCGRQGEYFGQECFINGISKKSEICSVWGNWAWFRLIMEHGSRGPCRAERKKGLPSKLGVKLTQGSNMFFFFKDYICQNFFLFMLVLAK